MSADGRFAHCTREERGGRLTMHGASRTFAHRLDGPCGCGVPHDGVPAPVRCGPALVSTSEARGGGVRREEFFARCIKPYPCDYTDASWAVLYRVARWERGGEKHYSMHRPVHDGWASGRGDAPRVLYRLPEVLAAVKRGEVVHVVEGEKKVHALRALGLVATSNDGGAGKFAREHAKNLHGACRVVVWADNDRPGQHHADVVARLLRAEGVGDVRLPVLPGLKHREGIDDWLAQNRGRGPACELRAALLRLAEGAQP